MHLFIDARFYGLQHTGLGRYTTSVLENLANNLPHWRITVLTNERISRPHANYKVIVSKLPHYSLAEQLFLPHLVKQSNADLFYTIHFNAPFLLRTPKIVTIHDLIKTHYHGMAFTTHVKFIYQLKHLAYSWLIKNVCKNAKTIIVPSNFVKNDLLGTFNLDPGKIHVIKEAVARSFQAKIKSSKRRDQFFLYVGNAYPHKNIEIILKALENSTQASKKLVLVSKRNAYLESILAKYPQLKIEIIDSIDDNRLRELYHGCIALITPSFIEGFGLPGLEALTCGAEVYAANIAVYREVYGKNVSYFDPYNYQSLVKLINEQPRVKRTSNQRLRSWTHVAEDIAEVINASSASL